MHVREKDYVWNPATCSCENGKYLASVMDNSVITCDEIVESYNEETRNISTNFNKKIAACQTQKFYILIAFLSITKALFITVSIYCYLITCWPNQKRLLPFHDTNNELKKLLYVLQKLKFMINQRKLILKVLCAIIPMI